MIFIGTQSRSQWLTYMTSPIVDANAPPDKESARLCFSVVGPNVNNALFRGEIKKELTFLRGCSAIFNNVATNEAEIVAEGKTKKMMAFIKWLETLELDIAQRKPNFQGPRLVASISAMEWQDYLGDIKGFSSKNEPPPIATAAGEMNAANSSGDMRVVEAITMTGTDESV